MTQKKLNLQMLTGMGLFLIALSVMLASPLPAQAQSAPEVENLSLDATSVNDLETDSLVSSYDLAGSATTAATAWYKNGSPSMVLYMPFEGGDSSALMDFSGNSRTVTTSGDPTWNPTGGHDGKGAYAFDGDDCLNAGHIFPRFSSYSKAAWIYSTNPGWSNIISDMGHTSGGHCFRVGADNKLSAGHNNDWGLVQDPDPIEQNTWYFVTITFDYPSGKMVLYRDAIAVDSVTLKASGKEVWLRGVLIGATDDNFFWRGTIDDAKIYNYALSSEQVIALYNTGNDLIVPNETNADDVWQAYVTPFSSAEAGATYPSNALTVQPAPPMPPSITTTAATSATVWQPYTYDVNATGFPQPSYELTTFPDGMTVNAYSGIIEWTPTTAGDFAVTVEAGNSEGTDIDAFSIHVPQPSSRLVNASITSTSGHGYVTDSLTCSYSLTGTSSTAATAWYKNDTPIMSLYMPFEGGATNALLNVSGNGGIATTSGDPTWNSSGGHDGKGAFEFDGNDYLDAGDVFPTYSSYTKTAWIYMTQMAWNNIISGEVHGAGGGQCFRVRTDNKMSSGHDGNWNIVEDSEPIELYTWYFVTVSFDYNTGEMILYRDGVAVDNAFLIGSAKDVTDTRVYVGATMREFEWHGTIDDARIYNHALSSEQISALYNDGSDLIVPIETNVGDVWQAYITPFSSTEAGTTYPSNTLTIESHAASPIITSTAITSAAVSQLYIYDVDAIGYPEPTYELITYPTDMTIDAASGRIEWTPAASGDFNVTVEATNSEGTDTESFSINVPEPSSQIDNPVLTSTSGYDLATDSLTCSYNLTGTSTTAATAWHKNDAPIMSLYMPFEGGNSNALLNLAGNGGSASISGNPIWDSTGGHDGNGAYEFDGNDYLDVGDVFPTYSSYTKTARIYMTATNWNNIISGEVHGDGGGQCFRVRFDDLMSSGHNGNWNMVMDSTPIELYTWYFVAVTFDYNTGEMVLYSDGVVVDTATLTGVDKDVTDTRVYVGATMREYEWHGTIDDARIYNYALSPEQISALHAHNNNLIVPDETGADDTWQAYVTPFSSTEVGATYPSNTLMIQSFAPPFAEFIADPASGDAGDDPLIVNFIDQSTNFIESWSWDFGDGETSELQNPTHEYTSADQYTVSLTVTGPGGTDTEIKDNYITVTDAAPIAEFTADPITGEAGDDPLIVNFSDQSSNLVTSWSWDFGDGETSDLQNPIHEYASSGQYTVSLTVTGPGGTDAETKEAYISVGDAAPIADFTADPITGEAGDDPLTVNFTDQSSNVVTSWSWDFGDGETSDIQNPIHEYASSGQYTVSLTVTGPGGTDAETKEAYINVGDAAPIADFTADPISGEAGDNPLAVNFTDQSSNLIDSWNWDFGDGETSDIQNPIHEYASSGQYTISLTVTGPGGTDAETKEAYISVGDAAPIADFTADPISGEAGDDPLIVNFSDQSSNLVDSWSWDFGDGETSDLQNPIHEYASSGQYTVSLTVTGPGGTDAETKEAYINVGDAAPIADFTADPISGEAGDNPLAVNFTDQSSNLIDSWSWDFGDGETSDLQNPIHEYASGGQYTVTLTVTGPGGTDSETKEAYISVGDAAPIADFTADPISGEAGDDPLTVNFTDQSSNLIDSWNWDFGDGETSDLQNPIYEYAFSGEYTVSLTVTGPGGTDSETKQAYISVGDAAPIADFTADPISGEAGDDPLTVNFTDQSSNLIDSWNWDFGDGEISDIQNPIHEYASSGQYTVTLTVTGPGGTDAETKEAYINVGDAAPIADFTADPISGEAGDDPLIVNFTDQSSNVVTSWSWDFGDGETSDIQNPIHEYASSGQYTVSLTVTGPGGTDAETKEAYINVGDAVPIADFTADPISGEAGDDPLTVNFTDQSSNVVTSWSWDFGDGETSDIQNPTHEYASGGQYTVTLTVTGPGGTDAETKEAYINVGDAAPIADFTADPTSGETGHDPLIVNFTDQSTNIVTSRSWDFGDGETSTLQNPSHEYTLAGQYTVTLTVTGPGGTDTMVKENYIDVTSPTDVEDNDSPELPRDYALMQNYPNPFNPVTHIDFSLPRATHVILETYNIMGQKVATLVDGPLDAGFHSVTWDSSNLASGVYFYRIQADEFSKSKKMTLVK